jgi:hypothetical protein
MAEQSVYVGIDVGKQHLDVAPQQKRNIVTQVDWIW